MLGSRFLGLGSLCRLNLDLLDDRGSDWGTVYLALSLRYIGAEWAVWAVLTNRYNWCILHQLSVLFLLLGLIHASLAIAGAFVTLDVATVVSLITVSGCALLGLGAYVGDLLSLSLLTYCLLDVLVARFDCGKFLSAVVACSISN